MKKLFALLWMFLACVTIAHAGNLEKGSDGSLRIQPEVVSYAPIDATITAEASAYEKEWKWAFANPGVVVPIETKTKPAGMADLFHERIIPVTKIGVIFDKETKTVRVVRDMVMPEEKRFNPYLIFCVIGVIAMTVAITITGKGFAVGIAFTFATVAAALGFAFAFSIAAAAAVAAIAAVTAYIDESEIKALRWCGIMYIMFISISVLFAYT